MADGDGASVGSEPADPGAESGSESEDDRTGGYSLVWRSLKVAFGSDSYLLRSYAVVGGLLATLVVVLVALAFPGWVARTLYGGGTATFSRAFLLVSGLLVVAPVLAPVVLAARRHRRGSATRRSDALFALSGYLFAGSLYVALLVSAPPGQREAPPSAVAPVVEFLYGLDPILAVVPPVLAAPLAFLVDRIA